MAKYRLRADHVIEGRIVPAGTEVGADTDIPFDGVPSNQMEGVDDEGRKKVNELHQRLYGVDAPWHTPAAEEARQRDREAYEAQQEEERESGKRASASARPVNPTPPPPQSQTKGGDNSGGPGVAQPEQDPFELEPRTNEPLKDQMPNQSSDKK